METKKSQDNILTEASLNEDKEYNKIKAKYQDLTSKRSQKIFWLYAIVVFLSFTGFLLWFAFDVFDKLSLSIVLGTLLISLFITIFILAFCSLLLENKKSVLQRRISEYEAEHIQENMEEDIFKNSIKMSYKYLDQYYHQTREQAQRGFMVTVYVAVFGAMLITGGIVAMMFFDATSPSYVTCAAGVITEFIAAVFFYLYNRTISSMSKYHNKLVLSQNISIALKIADSLPATDNTAAKNLIINELLKDINNHLVKEDISYV